MTKNKLLDYFLTKPGTFDESNNLDDIVFLNLASETICRINFNKKISMELKCKKSISKEMQEKFNLEPGDDDGIFQWNKIILNSEVSDSTIFEMIDESYDEVLVSLPKNEQDEILDLEL